MKLAKFRHRLLACIVDNLIIITTMALVLVLIWMQVLVSLVQDNQITISIVIKIFLSGIIYCLFLLFYYMVIPILLKGQTPGKWLFKIKVICDDNREVGYKTLFFREAICRILLRTLSFGISSFIAVFVMITRDDGKTIADVFAKTKVIDIKEEIKHVHSS